MVSARDRFQAEAARRAAARRAAQFDQRLRDGAAAPTPPTPSRPARQAAPAEHAPAPAAAAIAAAAVAVAASAVAVGAGSPLLAGAWSWPHLAGGTTVAVAGAAAAAHLSAPWPPARRWLLAGACAALVGLFAVGAAASVVIDGRVVAATSEQARAHRTAVQLADDLATIAAYDELLNLDVATARARFREYDPAIVHLRELSARNAALDPLPQFAQPVTLTAASAHWAAEALVLQQQLLVADDASARVRLANARAAFVDNTLQAGRTLAQASRLFGFEVARLEQAGAE